MRFTICLLFLFLLPFSRAETYVDICKADPRIVHSNITCKPDEQYFHIPPLFGNPFHALHDWLWAITMYLENCATRHFRVVVNEQFRNFSLCNSSESDFYVSESTPHWGECLLHFVVLQYGIPIVFHKTGFNNWIEDSQHIPNNSECSEHIWFGTKPLGFGTDGFGVESATFRGIDYFVRLCKEEQACNQTALIPLSDEQKQRAFHRMRAAVSKYVPDDEMALSRRVKILVYDRNDTTRRQWTNAVDVVEPLEADPRVQVRYIREIPKQFRSQVNLFKWPDIVVAPHGAALSNTLFMQPETDIIEIWHKCGNDARYSRFRLKDWTGWHTCYIGVNIAYVQCYADGEHVDSPGRLRRGEHGPPHQGEQRVHVDEVQQLLQQAILRHEKKHKLTQERLELHESHEIKNHVGWIINSERSQVFVVGISFVLLLISHRRLQK